MAVKKVRSEVFPIEEITDLIAKLFDENLRLHPSRATEDKFYSHGSVELAKIMSKKIKARQPIEMLLPGFPHKNPNRRKTLSSLPDLAEKMVLSRLEEFCAQVSEIYSPPGYQAGCRITIFSDGRVWGDLLGVSEKEILDYGIALRNMLPPDSPYILFENLDSYLTIESGEVAGSILERDFRPKSSVHLDDYNEIFDRFSRLIREDRLWKNNQSEIEITHLCSDFAKIMMSRHAAFRQLIKSVYHDVVRLSVHEGNCAGPQFSIRLFAEPENRALPYHCAIVLDGNGNGARAMQYEQAMKLPCGVDVVYEDGQPWCLQQRRE